MDSVEKKIERILVEGGEGKVYFPDDFFECGSEKAISKALQRLVARGVLMRMSRGIYCVPKPSAWGMGPLPASVDEILARLKSRDGFRTGPCGCEAQNMLGLSEQVVMNPVYSTDGPSRRINYHDGFRPIILEHVPPRIFNYKSRILMLTVWMGIGFNYVLILNAFRGIPEDLIGCARLDGAGPLRMLFSRIFVPHIPLSLPVQPLSGFPA